MSWQRFAPCRQADPDAWFPEKGEQGLEAKEICQSCPFRLRCLSEALERGEQYGIWGGINLSNDHNRRKARAQLARVATERELEQTFRRSA